jgi:glycosyltransferase involved in cell wall biosynthesis
VANAQIGVVVPTLNSAATLDWTLCSLHNQRDVTMRILVADSGSRDQTLDICKRWAVETIYVPPGNMYRAVNEGLRRMDAEWITYLNSDDIVYPESYARMMGHGHQESASVAYGDNDLIDYEGRFLFTLRAASPSRLERLLRHGRLAMTQAAAIFLKKDFEAIGGFDERYRSVADVDFFYRLAVAKKKFTKVPGSAVAGFRRHEKQLHVREATLSANEIETFFKANNLNLSLVGFFDLSIWRAENLPEYAWRLLRHGDSKWITRAVVGAKSLANSPQA